MKARSFINSGKTAVVLFTRGAHFKKNPDGSGSTGNWKLDSRRKFDQVVIYHRSSQAKTGEIFVGDFQKVTPSKEANRYIIHFTNLQHKGATQSNWFQFGNGTQNPVQFL